jgi:hypothetical protein
LSSAASPRRYNIPTLAALDKRDAAFPFIRMVLKSSLTAEAKAASRSTPE